MCVSAFQPPLPSLWHFNLATAYFMLLPWAVNCSWGADTCRPHDQAAIPGGGARPAGAAILFKWYCQPFIVEPFKSKVNELQALKECTAALFSWGSRSHPSVSSLQGHTASAAAGALVSVLLDSNGKKWETFQELASLRTFNQLWSVCSQESFKEQFSSIQNRTRKWRQYVQVLFPV